MVENPPIFTMQERVDVILVRLKILLKILKDVGTREIIERKPRAHMSLYFWDS